MINKGNSKTREELLKSILDGYVRSDLGSTAQDESAHLDEDSIAAFVEGNLSPSESAPFTSHLVSCGFCRHRTAELVRLDAEFADEADSAPVPAEPTKVSDVLSGILGRLFGSGEGAVFAHNEEDSEKNEGGDEEE